MVSDATRKERLGCFFRRQVLFVRPRAEVIDFSGLGNYPLAISLTPVVDALAAGNRILMKLPERSPVTSTLLAELVDNAFDATELAAISGGPDLAQEFTRLPFNLLVYTGGGVVGRAVRCRRPQSI